MVSDRRFHRRRCVVLAMIT